MDGVIIQTQPRYNANRIEKEMSSSELSPDSNSDSSYFSLGSSSTTDEFDSQSKGLDDRSEKRKCVRKTHQKPKPTETEKHVQRLTIENQELSQHIHGLQCELAKLKTTYHQQSLKQSHAYAKQLDLAKNLYE